MEDIKNNINENIPDHERDSRKKIFRLIHDCNKILYFNSMYGEQQTKILIMLSEGSLSQKDIQERLNIQPATVSEHISKLEAKGLVERSRSDEDRRLVVLSLTESGKKSAENRLAKSKKTGQGISFILDEKEQDDLLRLLDKLHEGLTQPLKSDEKDTDDVRKRS